MSTDGCSIWTDVDNYFIDGFTLAQDPRDSNVTYAGGNIYSYITYQYQAALSKTTDAGKTWPHKRLLGLPGEYGTACRDIGVSPSDPNFIYAVGQHSQTIKVYRSDNAADTFRDVTGNLSSYHFNYDAADVVWIAPEDPNYVLAGTTKGVFVTTTGGDTWSETTINFPVVDFTYHSGKGIIYAAATSNGVYFSDDRGLSWASLKDGLDYQKMLRLALDSENNILFAGTDGGGAYRLNLDDEDQNLSPDVNGDGIVNIIDFSLIASQFSNPCSPPLWCSQCDLDTSGLVDSGDLKILTDSWLWCRADLNSDFSVDLSDFAILAENYLDVCLPPDWCHSADINFTGTVDLSDLFDLLEYWLR
jgi:hypothetical protein